LKREVLYISDLDGTLLTSNRELSNYSKDTLNRLIDSGVHFSVATARSSATALKILEDLNIKVPVILMNGVVIYDITHGRYLKLETIPTETAKAIINIFKNHDISGFMYTISNKEQITYYENLCTKSLKDFHDERVSKYGKAFEKVANFLDKADDSNIIYFSFMDLYERLYLMYNELSKHQEIEAVMYRDVYNENIWFMEIHSKNASKYNAVKYLREQLGYEKIIGFGDNLNDLPLLRACDEFYAVSNAVEELKKKANGIIDDNNSDGVAKFIYRREQL
jgi:Cof subfamily protein (haloacid dehalogenase superfamily)